MSVYPGGGGLRLRFLALSSWALLAFSLIERWSDLVWHAERRGKLDACEKQMSWKKIPGGWPRNFAAKHKIASVVSSTWCGLMVRYPLGWTIILWAGEYVVKPLSLQSLYLRSKATRGYS